VEHGLKYKHELLIRFDVQVLKEIFQFTLHKQHNTSSR